MNPCLACKYGPNPCKWAKAGLESKSAACGPYARYLGEQKLADRTQQLLNDWAYLDDAEFVQKYQIKKTFLPHLCAEWLKGQL